MKLTMVLMVVSIMQVSAISYAQKITLTEKNVSLKQVFSKIRNQTGYGFLYTDAMLNESKPVTISVINASIEETLDRIFKDQPIFYSLENNTVIVKRRQNPVQIVPEIIQITGKVTDPDGEPLVSVGITLKGTTVSTLTDSQGNYKISVPDDGTLVFSFIGFNSQEVKVANRKLINITMHVAVEDLGEVVVIAYGTVKKEENTSSTVKVDYNDFKNRPLTNIASALEGAAPGIQSLSASGQPGEAPAIRIRGFGSVNADQNPIYVVDGVIYDGGLSNFNMEDVESLSVLKDAASTALYGSRGANGVIIITTKKGKKNSTGLSFKANQGFVSRALPEYERIDAYQYYPLMWEAYSNYLVTSGQTATVARQNATNGIKTQLGYNPFNVADNDIVRTDGSINPNAKLLYADDLDWESPLDRTGLRQEYSLGFNGANDKANYYASLGYVNEKGFLINSGQDRFMGRLNVNSQPLKWFKIGLNLSGTVSASERGGLQASTNISNPFFVSRFIGPIYPVYVHNPTTGDFVYDSEGNKIYDEGAGAYGLSPRPGAAFGSRHVVKEINLDKDTYNRNYFGARSFADLIISKDLKLTTNISIDLTDQNNSTYANNIIGPSAPAGSLIKDNSKLTSYTFNQLLNYTKTFKSHNFALLLGHENYSRNIQATMASRTSQIAANNYELNNFAVITGATSSIDNYRTESYFSRINYDFKGKYFLSASVREDGNSRFHPDYRWEPFYSVGLAWRLDRENFLINSQVFNALKLRTSYGRVGNDAGIGYYPYQALYALGFNNGTDAGIRQSNVPNAEITWEGQKSIDAAVEFGLFKNRISGSVEYYNRISDDLIFDASLPLSLGGYSFFKNIGALVNKGWEIQINTELIRRKSLSWSIGLNGSTLTNKITKMPDDRPEITESTNYRKLSVGHSIYDFYLVDFKGVDPADGLALYTPIDATLATNRTINGEVLTTVQSNAKYTYAGSPIPKLFGSFNTRIGYKGFEFSALLTYQIGGKILDQPYASLMHNGSFGYAWHTDILKACRNPGDITDVPKLENGAVNLISNRYLKDASYLNLRSISLGYNFPVKWNEHIKAKNIRLYANGENLHWFSARKGMNVQQSFTGITSNAYVPAKTITLGLNVDF